MKSLWVLRLVALSLLFIVAMKPVVVKPDPSLPSDWAVLVDSSQSMAVKDPAARLDQAKKILANVAKKFPRFNLFQFSEKVEPIETNAIDSLAPKGRESNLASALKNVFEGNKFRGALVLSDGRQVGSGDAISQAAGIGRPIIAVGFGDKSLFRDVSVKSIQSPPFAFKNVQTSLSATISVVGYAGQRVVVKLRQGKKVLGIQTIQVAEQEIESTVTFNWTPRSLGTKTLVVEANRYSGEFTTQNNRKGVTLDVGRDRFRVLYICGKPGPEYGFLRHQFKSDPAVELVTFVILRNASNVVNVPDAELSLIPFPTQDVLIKQISTFDLVVFEEFSYERFGLPPQLLFAIRKKVEDGGSFLVMGGNLMLGKGSRYALPGIQEMIPVQFGQQDISILNKPVRMIPKAPNHPILRLFQNADKNRKIWKKLPELEDVALIPGIKSKATVLGAVQHGGKEYPILVAWKFGKGRVATMTARTTWRWSMLDGGDGLGSYAYQQFWKNMVLWLTHSDEFKSVRVALEKRKIRLGEEEAIRVWAYDEYFQPISDVDVRVQVKTPSGTKQELKVFQETKGVFAASFKSEELGRYRASAWVLRNGKKMGQDSVRFDVIEGYSESEDLRPDFETLKEMASATGGQFISASQFSVDAFEEFDKDVSEKIGKKVLLWNSPWFLLAILIFMILEWAIRKRRGLP